MIQSPKTKGALTGGGRGGNIIVCNEKGTTFALGGLEEAGVKFFRKTLLTLDWRIHKARSEKGKARKESEVTLHNKKKIGGDGKDLE